MLWVLNRTFSMRRFFWAPETHAKIMGKKIFAFLRCKYCLNLWPLPHYMGAQLLLELIYFLILTHLAYRANGNKLWYIGQ